MTPACDFPFHNASLNEGLHRNCLKWKKFFEDDIAAMGECITQWTKWWVDKQIWTLCLGVCNHCSEQGGNTEVWPILKTKDHKWIPHNFNWFFSFSITLFSQFTQSSTPAWMLRKSLASCLDFHHGVRFHKWLSGFLLKFYKISEH